MVGELTLITVAFGTGSGTEYVANRPFRSLLGDSPSNQKFDARILGGISFVKKVSTHFWGGRPRGSNSYGVIRIANGDGYYDGLDTEAIRDQSVVIKRKTATSIAGLVNAGYASLTTLAVLRIDSVEFEEEKTLAITVVDSSAKLDEVLQTLLYNSTNKPGMNNASLLGAPIPTGCGRAFQVPMPQPITTGLGRYELHDDSHWLGVEEILDAGVPLAEGLAAGSGIGYRRSNTTNLFGIDRLSALGGKQVATKWGAFGDIATVINETFADLSGWTETNGGVANRDASVSGGVLRMLNTAGGADLKLAQNADCAIVDGAGLDWYFYEFDCTIATSGKVRYRAHESVTVDEKIVDAVGHYSGVFKSSYGVITDLNPAFFALDGENADISIANYVVKRVQPIERLDKVIYWLCVTKSGLLTPTQASASSLIAFGVANPYPIGFSLSEPMRVSDILDAIMPAFGGWWRFLATDRLTVGRLEDPTSGTSVLSIDQYRIKSVAKKFDRAPGLSNVILAQKNWSPYALADVKSVMKFVSLNSNDKGSNYTLSNSNYSFTGAGAGSALVNASMFGGKKYAEMQATAVGGGTEVVGVAARPLSNSTSPIGSAYTVMYLSSGVDSPAGTSMTTWGASDYVGVCMDSTLAAMGCHYQGHRLYFMKNGAFQASQDPDSHANPSLGVTTSGYAALQYFFAGASATGFSGTFNLGNAPFQYAGPVDYSAPASYITTITSDFRFRYESSTALSPSYAHAIAAANADAIKDGRAPGGTITWLSDVVYPTTECDRWCALFSVDRWFWTIVAYLDDSEVVLMEPGVVFDVSYTRFGLSATKMQLIGIEGDLTKRQVTITGWS